VVPAAGALQQVLQDRAIAVEVLPYYNWAFTQYISVSYWLSSIRQFQNKYQYLPQIIEKVAALDADIIYTNSSIVGIGAWVADQLKIPHVWHVREFGKLDYNMIFWRGRSYFDRWANRSSLVISMSAAIDKAVLQGINAPKVVIHDGIVDKATYESIQAPQDHLNPPFTFLIIGAIHPTKGQMTALKAFHKLYKTKTSVRLIIAGTGRRLYARKIQQYIQKHRLSSVVKYLGYVKNPYEVHAQADAVLMCSKSEGMGRVTIEGMLFGNPVIGYNGGATPELIDHAKNGLIYQDIDELLGHMRFLVEHPQVAQNYGKAGRIKAAKNFLIEEFVRTIFAQLQNIEKPKTRSVE
jgi:glycosyltransferase involved in cell wall biosynthesis